MRNAQQQGIIGNPSQLDKFEASFFRTSRLPETALEKPGFNDGKEAVPVLFPNTHFIVIQKHYWNSVIKNIRRILAPHFGI